jgi:hypothetical protein
MCTSPRNGASIKGYGWGRSKIDTVSTYIRVAFNYENHWPFNGDNNLRFAFLDYNSLDFVLLG